MELKQLIVSVSLISGLSAQNATKTWMDLPVGTVMTWTSEGADESQGGPGQASSNNGKHEIRIACLGRNETGHLRLAILDEHLPQNAHEVAIINGEIVTLDPATGRLGRSPDITEIPFGWSPEIAFPYPPLSSAEWKSKKADDRSVFALVGGESQRLPMKMSFDQVKSGRKKLRAVIGEIEAPADIQMVGVAGMLAMMQGRAPKMGVSGIEPVDAKITELRREFHCDKKGRVLAVRTTSKFEAGDGVLKFEGSHTMQEIDRKKLKGKQLVAFTEVVEELCSIVNSKDGKPARKKRAEALQAKAKAKKLGLAATIDRVIDACSRSGLPPGVGR